MPRRADPQLRVLWRKRLQRFSSSGLSVERFCSQERLSTSALYSWRKKLDGTAVRRRTSKPAQQAFRQVAVVPPLPGVSIHLPGGARIEVRCDQLDAVRAVIGELARADGSHGDATTC